MRYFCGLLLLVFSASVPADPTYIYTVAGFQCDPANDVLLLTYDGAYDLAGQNLVRDMKPDHWDLWTLYYSGKSIQKRCSLSDGDYELTLSLYNTGSCYDCYGFWAKVTNGGKLVFNEGLHGFEGPPAQIVITRAVIKSHNAQPELTRRSWDDFVEQSRLDKQTP